jgi:hypothetical protein
MNGGGFSRDQSIKRFIHNSFSIDLNRSRFIRQLPEPDVIAVTAAVPITSFTGCFTGRRAPENRFTQDLPAYEIVDHSPCDFRAGANACRDGLNGTEAALPHYLNDFP